MYKSIRYKQGTYNLVVKEHVTKDDMIESLKELRDRRPDAIVMVGDLDNSILDEVSAFLWTPQLFFINHNKINGYNRFMKKYLTKIINKELGMNVINDVS